MQTYRLTIKKRTAWLTALLLTCIAFGVYDTFFAVPALKEAPSFKFLTGLTLLMGFLALRLIMRYKKALEDETALKRLYLHETDERQAYIRSHSGQPLIIYTSGAMLVAAIFAGHFLDVATMKALAVAAFAQMAISVMVNIYHTNRTTQEDED